MEFLKDILGNDLYTQVETKVNSYNESNKEKQVKVANLSTGEYVSKSKYDALQTDLNNTKTSLETANTTIADLKKNNGDNASLQTKIQEYETKIANLENVNKENLSKLIKESAIKEALYAEKAKHPELLLSKFDLSKILLDEKGEKVVSGIDYTWEKIKNREEGEIYKDLFGEVETKPAYRYVPQGGSGNPSSGATDFVGIIKENQSRKL